MSVVVHLEERRRERQQRVEDRMHSALMHPSLRWVTGPDEAHAHRRSADHSVALCGVEGSLTLAAPGVALCPDCYPMAGQRVPS